MTTEKDRSRFAFSSNWFQLIEHEWETRTKGLRGKKLSVLEIGSFEGASTTWILDNFMAHPESSMVAIDTFEGGMEHQGQDFALSSLEQRFQKNLSKCEHRAKLQVLKMRSDEGLMQLAREKRRFGLIYVDASHVAIDVLYDAIICWRLLEVGGMLIFDDYSWKGYLEDCYNPRVAIESFIKCAAPEIETEETESQLWVKKRTPAAGSGTETLMARRVAFSDTERAIRYLEDDGGVILTDFATKGEVATVNADTASYINAVAAERARKKEPRGTVRCHRLFGRSQTAREGWLQRSQVRQILNHFLETSSLPYNHQSAEGIKTEPILSASATMEISPGEKAQDLHRDDFIWQQTHNSDRTKFENRSEISMGIIVPGTQTRYENGATAFIPKSHLWSHSRRPDPDEVHFAEMNVGEAFVFFGSTVHGGGMNRTTENRTVHGFFFCRSWIRPEENQLLWWTKEEISKWSVGAQKQAGYLLGNPFVGHCNEVSPMEMFRVSEAASERQGP